MVEAFLINPVKPRRKKATTTRAKAKRKTKTRARKLKNPLGEEIIVLGGNPMRRKRRSYRRSTTTRTRTKRRAYRRNPNPPRRRRRRSYRRNPVVRYITRRTPRRRSYRRNPIIRRRRRRTYRRNPAMLRVGMPNIKRPATLVMPLLVGVGAKLAADRVPSMLNLSGLPAVGAQFGVAVAGGLFLQGPIGQFGAVTWLVVAGATAMSNLLNQTVLKGMLSDDLDIAYPALTNEEVEYLPSPMGVGNSNSLGEFIY